SYAVMDANQTHASVAAALAQKINVWGLPEFHATSEGGVLRIVNIAGNVFTTTFKVTRGSVDDIRTARAVEADAALVATRIDGINYYRVDVLNIDLGSRNDVFNVQGTSARTNLNLHDGDDRIYVSSTADFDLGAPVPDFLLGHLHNLNGMLNIDAGAGHHVLKISGEASTLDQPNIVISDTLRASEPSNAEIAVRGMSGGTNAFGWVDLPAGTITSRADASGDFGPEIEMWTGYGADTVTIDGTFVRPGLRTVTMLSTGLGNDVVTVNLNSVEDDFFVLNTQGPYNNYLAISDDDKVYGAASTLPLVIFGGQGDDYIQGGSGDDIVFGDRGRVHYTDATGRLVTLLGNAGVGDFADGVVRQPVRIFTVDPAVGGDDTINALAGNDRVLGG